MTDVIAEEVLQDSPIVVNGESNEKEVENVQVIEETGEKTIDVDEKKPTEELSLTEKNEDEKPDESTVLENEENNYEGESIVTESESAKEKEANKISPDVEKKTKRRSLFRKSKVAENGLNVSNSEEKDQDKESISPPASKISRKRFTFGSKKTKKSATANEEAKELDCVEDEAPKLSISKDDEVPLLKEHIYDGPKSKTSMDVLEENDKKLEISENPQNEGEQDTPETIVEESKKKEIVSKIPVKKLRKIHWKRMSRTFKESSEETPESNIDCELTQEASEAETTQEEQSKEELIEEEIPISKKVGKSRRLLKWKRSSRNIEDVESPKDDENAESEEQKVEEVSTQTTIDDEADTSAGQGQTKEDEEELESGDEVAEKKKNIKKSKRLSWRRFGWNKSQVSISKPVANTEDECEENEKSIQTENEAVVDGEVTSSDQVAVLELEKVSADEPEVTINAITPTDSDITIDAEDVADNSLEQSVLTQVTQIAENMENGENTVAKQTSTNPFLDDNDSAIVEAIEAESTANQTSQEENEEKTLDFVLVDQYTNKPKEESFYLTKKALKVYNKAHLAQHYCQPCCNVM